MKTRFQTALVLTTLLGLAPAASASLKTVDRIACVVNDQPIMLSEVEERARILRPQLPAASEAVLLREAAEALVSEKLFDKAMKELAIEVAPNEVSITLQSVMQQNGFTSEEQLRAAVEQQGLDWDEYRRTIEKQLMQSKLLRLKVGSQVKVGDEEVKRRYAELAAAEKGEEELSAAHVLVPVGRDASPGEVEAARARAAELAAEARGGRDFATIAGSTEGVEGGDLGWFRRGELLPELEKAAFALRPGEIGEPVRSKFGWHVVKVNERRQAAPVPFEQVADQLREKLYREELDEQTRRYVMELRKAAVITWPVAELAPPNRS